MYRLNRATASFLVTSLLAGGSAEGGLEAARGECAATSTDCESDADAVELLQRTLLNQEAKLETSSKVETSAKVATFADLSREAAHEAAHAALDEFEAHHAKADTNIDIFGSDACKRRRDSSCPQVKCGPLMVNTSCPNLALGTGRPTCGACRADDLTYNLVRVRTADIAQEMSYAGPGSEIPEELHGIWWMDQFGYSVDRGLLSCDPSFEYYFPNRANELVLTFGDTATWNPKTQCVENRIYYGGERGSWAWFDSTGKGTNNFWTSAYKTGTVMTFCKRQGKQTPVYDIYIKVRFSGSWLLTPVFKLLNFKRLPDDYWQVSDKPLGTYSMKKTCFGWERETITGNGASLSGRTRKFVREWFPFLNDLVDAPDDRVRRYPVFQVVDGEGQKTRNWDVFYQWASSGAASLGENNGGDTALLGRPAR